MHYALHLVLVSRSVLVDFNYKNVLIYGYGISGKAVEEQLIKIGANYKIYDKQIRVGGGQYVLKLNAHTLKEFDLVVLSPGVSIFNRYVKLAHKLGIKVIGELEFAYMFLDTKIIGVTGTNGKTSTVGLITHMLSLAGYQVQSYGNIGVPLCNAIGKDLDYVVCEISSFQLESIENFKCDICAILNIDEDHLDRHKNLKNYIACKLAIAKNSTPNDYVVLNDDDYECNRHKDYVSGKLMFTSSHHVVEGVYAKDNAMYYNNGVGISELFSLTDCKLKSKYLDNIMCAVCIAKILDIDNSVIIKSIKTWNILPHRLEFVTKNAGVTYINDSKSTNIHSVKKAIDSVNGNIILLLGGENKDLDFTSLVATLPRNIKSVVTFGKSAKYLYKLCKKYGVNSYLALGVEEAVIMAHKIAVKGDTILFSPGCTSFDEFSSYIERGEKFKQYVFDVVSDEE